MTKQNPLCNLSGGRVLIKRNSKEIWREVSLIPQSYGTVFYQIQADKGFARSRLCINEDGSTNKLVLNTVRYNPQGLGTLFKPYHV